MDITEIKTVAYQITQLWINLLLNYNTINNKEQRFLSLLKHQSDIVFKYEDRALLDKAMECIPLQSLYEQAETRNPDSLDDQLIQCLLHWFKYEFFSWVDTLPCEQCGYKKTKMNGYVDPSSEDLRYGATRVETFFCTQCAHITRFPRYNDPGKLLETRKGRCGEWANCFTLCCRAIGFEARIVYDTADHVWTEIYSEYQQRWIHCDSCEDAWDKPLLYTTGWKKELAYCIASSVDEMVDVTKRYTLSLKNRYAVNERALALERMALERRKELNERSLRELMELEKPRVAQEEEGHGRISGSLTWRAMRGEAGASINIMKLLDSCKERCK
ncbi:peptide-N(4)-(N-acetyl-beta-glucosaminyl)asparagine amidase [Pilobolus umbonatus]|nr:peptide-N(4)-(N-acetyl-beta-glucosaminyl)asparagine amidase [Pilobolus umbonatus]